MTLNLTLVHVICQHMKVCKAALYKNETDLLLHEA